MTNETKKERFGFLDYAEKVRLAKLDGGSKGLLWFYASTYNWKNKKPSYYTERSICSLVGMSLGTYHNRRKYLEELGWISVYHKGKHNSAHVGVKVGIDDPDYENKCWAEWHPSNRNYDEVDVEWDHETGEFIAKKQLENPVFGPSQANEYIEIDGFLLKKNIQEDNLPKPDSSINAFISDTNEPEWDDYGMESLEDNFAESDPDADWDNMYKDWRLSTSVEW